MVEPIKLAGAAASSLRGILDRFIENPQERLRAEAALRQAIMDQDGEFMRATRDVITAEAKSEGILARNWRPITMLCFVAIITNNYILAPYLSLFGVPNVTLEIPDNMWNLLSLGIGGYMASRGAEKVTRNLARAGLFGKKS